MKPRVCLLLDRIDEIGVGSLLNAYLPAERFEVAFANVFPTEPRTYTMIVPWNYRRIIPQAAAAGNVIVFHASNLPEGRGWAPIYYTLREERPEYVLCGIRAANEVDRGDIVVRARFPVEPDYDASFLRLVDTELSLLLIAKILEKWPDGHFVGYPQQGQGSDRPRRGPAQSEVNPACTLNDLLPHLRGVEPAHPAFFFHEGRKYIVEVRPAEPPRRPRCVRIEFPALQHVEAWEGWA